MFAINFIGTINVFSGQSIGTVFQGPGFESRWRCMFFTLVVLALPCVTFHYNFQETFVTALKEIFFQIADFIAW